MILLSSLTFLVLLLALLLSTAKVQTLLAQRFTARINTNFETNFALNQFTIDLDGKASLNGLYIEDHHADTLAYVNNIRLSLVDLNTLLDGKIQLHSLFLDNIQITNTQYEGEKKDALSQFISLFNKRNNDSTAAPVSINTLEISKGLYHQKNKEEKQKKSFQLQEVNLKAKNLILSGKNMEGQILSFSGVESLKGTEFSQGQFLFDYSPKEINLKALEVKTNNEYIAGNFSLKDSINSLTNWKDSAELTIELDSISVEPNKWFKKQANRISWPKISGSIYGKGNLQNFILDTLALQSEWGFIALKGNAINLDKLENLNLNLQFYVKDLAPKKIEIPLDRSLVSNFNLQDRINFEGQLELENSKIDYDFSVVSDWFAASVKGHIGKGFLFKEDYNDSFDIETKVKRINMNRFANASTSSIYLSGDLKCKGEGRTLEELKGSWQLKQLKVFQNKKKLITFNGSGSYEDKQLNSSITTTSEFLSLKSDLVFDHSLDLPKIATAVNIEALDLNYFSKNLGGGKALFEGILLGNISGSNLNNMTGSLTGASLSLETAVDTLYFSPFTLNQKTEDEERVLEIKNQDIIQLKMKGNYKNETLLPLFQNALSEVYTFLPEIKIESKQSLLFNVTIYEKILNALYPKLQAKQNINISGKINSTKKQSQIIVDSPFFNWEDFNFENIHFQLDTQNPIYNTYLSVDELVYKNEKVKDFNIISTSLKDTLYFRSEFSRSLDNSPFAINFYHTLDMDKKIVFGIQNSDLTFKDTKWKLNPQNSKMQKILYDSENKRLEWNNFSLESDSRTSYLRSSGSWQGEERLSLSLDIKNLPWEAFIPQKDTFKTTGFIGLSMEYIKSPEENKLLLDGEWKDSNVNGQTMGNLRFNANGNTQLNSYQIQMSLVDQNLIRFQGKGTILGKNDPKLNLDFNFNDFEIGFLSPLGKKAVDKIRGNLTGDVNVWGPLSKLNHNGQLNLRQAGIGVPYLNTDYSISEAKVNLYEQTFDFTPLELVDSKEQTRAQLKGKINHNNFKDWNTSLAAKSSRIMLLNKLDEPEVLFYGDGYLNGDIFLEGPFKNLNITVTGRTEKGTSIKIPWSEDYGLADTSYIELVNKSVRSNEPSGVEINLAQDEISGVEMNFELDVDPNAEIEIVIDQETGSFLKGRGAGSLFMEINTLGKFNMWGDFITYDGIYNFKNLGVIDKKFNVKPGGTIVWEGDPLSAQMNIEALYEVPGGANPALMLDNPNFNKKIPTEVLIQLQGNLLKPDDPLFEIQFPNTSGTVASEINYRLADPQRRQLQALSLLSQGIFINEVSVSMEGITNNLYQKASDIFSSLLNEDNNKLQIGVDYLQGDKSALLDIASADRLGFTLSTKLSEKILLNGKIGVPVGGVEQTLVVGNVQIDFILNEDGTLKAKVFNKENEFRYIGDELGYTQGVGLSYEVDFDTFGTLIQKIIKDPTKEENKLPSVTVEVQEENSIDFINKN